MPKDTDAVWQIGFSIFSTENLSPENAYLSYSLPLLLKDAASGLSEHTLSDQERNLVARAAITRELATADAAISTASKDRGSLAWSDTTPTDASLAAADARVATAQARRDFLAALDPALVQVAATKSIRIKEGTGAGMLLDLPAVPPDVYCARQGIEMLIGGSLREVQGYLLLDVWAYDALRGQMVYSSRNAAQRDELYASVGSMGRELVSLVLGRAWSRVIFSPDPKGAALYVDGSLIVTGASPALYLLPGFHEVTISASGYGEITRTVTLDDGGETTIDDVLQKSAGGTITISTDPEGADLYVDSVWEGTTPFALITTGPFRFHRSPLWSCHLPWKWTSDPGTCSRSARATSSMRPSDGLPSPFQSPSFRLLSRTTTRPSVPFRSTQPHLRGSSPVPTTRVLPSAWRSSAGW